MNQILLHLKVDIVTANLKLCNRMNEGQADFFGE